MGDWEGNGFEYYRRSGTSGTEKMKKVPYKVSMNISKVAEGVLKIRTSYTYQGTVVTFGGTTYTKNDPAGDFSYNALIIADTNLQALSLYNDADNTSQLIETFNIDEVGTMIKHKYSGTSWDTLFAPSKIGLFERLVNQARGIPTNKNRMLVSAAFTFRRK